MHNFDSAFEKVSKLVNDFKANEEKYLSPDYQEAHVRREFIDNFFEALGWDIYYKIQKNPYEREVKVETRVFVGKAQKRADYAFYISPEFREPKFFAEAKKPSRNLKNALDYFQTIRYGWNANTPVAVLTDFEEFHILDCRFKPDIDYVLQNQNHKSYKYTDYSDSEKFKEIYFLFSRDAVANGSLQKYSDFLPKPKGKATQWGLFKGVVKPIDEDFLEYIDDVRETLAKAFKKNDTSLSSEQLTEVTQKTVDRLVFIRFLEDKLIEPDFYISEIGKKNNPWKEFITLCKKLDEKYNGIVFKETSIDKQNFKGPEEEEFLRICEEISHLNTPYDFHYIPIHILGSIYERFLGKIVTLKGRGIKIEEKPEVRKAGGVYYTPKYIVDYIVQNTIGKLIENKTPEEISKLRFADIACGSGSFLIGVYELLLEYHNTYYQNNPKEAKKDGCVEVNGIMTLSLKQKQDILLNNIYGVDIDHQAVEVTQLSLALKMLEDENTFSTRQMQMEFHKKIIPEQLSKNIVCGNSLIGTDILSGSMFAGDEERKLNPMDFETVFPEVFKNGGFDAIVGNPPYVVVKGGRYTEFEESKIVIDYYKNNYNSLQQQINIFVAFLEKALIVCKKDRFIGYIIPNTLLTNDYCEDIRKYLLNNFEINILYNAGQVFSNAVVEGLVIICIKRKPDLNEIISIFKDKTIKQKQILFKKTYLNRFLIHLTPDLVNIINKCKKDSIPLIKFSEVWRGLTTGDDKKYLCEKKINKNYKKIIQGKQIHRYIIDDKELYVNYLINELDRARPQYIFEKKEKIISKFIGKDLGFSYDSEQLYVINTGCLIFMRDTVKVNLKYILGILNSKLINFYFSNQFTDYRDVFPIIKSGHLEELPIKEINFQLETEKKSHDLIVSLVDQMLDAKKQLHNSKTDRDKTYYERKCESLDRQIDAEVYKLYGLTEEEIKIVEGKND